MHRKYLLSFCFNFYNSTFFFHIIIRRVAYHIRTCATSFIFVALILYFSYNNTSGSISIISFFLLFFSKPQLEDGSVVDTTVDNLDMEAEEDIDSEAEDEIENMSIDAGEPEKKIKLNTKKFRLTDPEADWQHYVYARWIEYRGKGGKSKWVGVTLEQHQRGKRVINKTTGKKEKKSFYYNLPIRCGKTLATGIMNVLDCNQDFVENMF